MCWIFTRPPQRGFATGLLIFLPSWVYPTTKGELQRIEVVGNIAVLLGMVERAENNGTAMMVAGAGFEPTTFRL